jgi:hypothetical protein
MYVYKNVRAGVKGLTANNIDSIAKRRQAGALSNLRSTLFWSVSVGGEFNELILERDPES